VGELIGVFFHVTARDLLPLLELGIAVVRLEAEPKAAGPAPLDNLFVDNKAAVHTAVGFLIARCHRRIGMLAGATGPAELRTADYRQALAEHGLPLYPELVCVDDFTEAGGHRAMAQLLAVASPPDAVFAANDMMALGALAAIKGANLRILGDIALVGFNDIPIDRLVTPALTTVAQFQSPLGSHAAELLLERLRGHALAGRRSVEMPFEIVVREST
jgi:LacI family transcriptional regulator